MFEHETAVSIASSLLSIQNVIVFGRASGVLCKVFRGFNGLDLFA